MESMCIFVTLEEWHIHLDQMHRFTEIDSVVHLHRDSHVIILLDSI